MFCFAFICIVNQQIYKTMKRFIFFATAFLAVFTAAQAQELKQQDPAKHQPRVFPMPEQHLSFYSQVLGKEKNFSIILPKSYNTEPNRRYPIVYLLHGFGENDWEWANINVAMIIECITEAVAGGEAAEMIIVKPNATEYNFGYHNQPDWKYADYFFNELMPTVEKQFRVIGDKGHRAIGGLSMGGGGSLTYGFMHPELFSSVYAMSAGLAKITPHDSNNETAKRLNGPIDIENLTPAQVAGAKTVAWTLDCGDDDPLLDGVLLTYQQFKKNGINCNLRVGEGVHATYYWYNGLARALRFWTRHFSEQMD